MKKALVLLMVGALTASTLMTGCGAKGNDEVSAPEEAAEAADDLSAPMESQVVELDLVEFDYSALDHVTLGEYKGMDIEVDSEYEVTEENVIEQINQELQFYPEQLLEGTVADGDIVNLTYEGTRDDNGEVFQPEASDTLEIGSGTYIPGFEEGVVGATVGETFDLHVTFPDDYASEDLQGQDATFKVTVNHINVPITYEDLTDEYVSENFGIDTLDEFKANVEETLKQTEDAAVAQAIIEKVIETSTVDSFPEGMVEQNTAIYKNQYLAMSDEYGYEFSKFLETYYGMTEEEFDAEIQHFMEENLGQQLILQAIVEAEGIPFDEEGYQEYAEGLASSYGYESVDDVYAEYTENYVRVSYICNTLATQFLIDNNNVIFVSADDEAAADGEDLGVEEAEEAEEE